MYPRPRSRGRAVAVPHAEDLAEECRAALQANGVPAVAIVTGRREWTMVRRQEDYRKHGEWWLGGDETFCKVPVVISRYHSTPKVIATMLDLSEIMLEENHG